MNDHIERTKRMIEVMQAYVDGERIEYLEMGGAWQEATTPSWGALDYRIAKTPDTINWDHVAPGFKYMARDADGFGYLYTEKPNMGLAQHNAPIKGRIAACDIFDSYQKGTVDWKESLVIRPGFE